MSFLTSLFSAIGEFFGWAKQRDAEKNTAAMQANTAAKTQQASVDEATAEVTTALEHPADAAALEALRKGVAK
jgi:hypothetical protein